MNVSLILALIAGALAIISLLPMGANFPLLAIAVLLLAIAVIV